MSKRRRGTTISDPSEEPPTPSSSPAAGDEKLFKAYELYLSERTRLSAAKQEQAKAYDRTILTFSAGAVALSITFLEKVVKDPNAKGWLYTSWILFALAMMSTLYSLLVSQKAFEGEIAQLDTRYQKLVGLPAEDLRSPSSPPTAWGVSLIWLKTFAAIFTPALTFFSRAVKWLNRFAGVFFFFGIICFGWFALENWVFLKERKPWQQQRSRQPPQPYRDRSRAPAQSPTQVCFHQSSPQAAPHRKGTSDDREEPRLVASDHRKRSEESTGSRSSSHSADQHPATRYIRQ